MASERSVCHGNLQQDEDIRTEQGPVPARHPPGARGRTSTNFTRSRFALHPPRHDLLPLRSRRRQRVRVRRRPVGHRVRRRRPRRGGRAPARPACRRVALFTDATLARASSPSTSVAPARCAPRGSTSRSTPTCTSSRPTSRSARPPSSRRRAVRRLRLGRRRLGHRHVQGGAPLRDLPGRAPHVRQRADRRRQAGPRAAAAAHRLPDDVRHRQRVHRHRRLRRSDAQGEDRHRVAAPAADARAHRPDVHAHAARDGRRGERLRRPLPRARVVHGAARTRRAPAPTSRPRVR